MSKATEVVIGSTTYIIRPFDAFTQLRLFGDLQREILPAMGGLLNVVADKKEDDAKINAAGVQALRELSERLGGAALEKWANALIHGDYIAYQPEGDRTAQKLDRAGQALAFSDFSEILELLFHICRVNFAAPFARWVSLTGLARSMAGRLSGSSGEILPMS